MSKIRYFFRDNPLTRMIRSSGGVRLDEAVARAEANLETIRQDCIAAIDTDIARLERLLDKVVQRPETTVLVDAYQRSNAVAGVAGSCGMAELGEAAFSLCDLLDRLRTAGGWNADAVAVHLNTIRLLRVMAGKGGGAAERAVLEGLHAVATRVVVEP